MGPSHRAVDSGAPVQARAMDKADIANFRRWHRKAALRARAAGFDIVYVYAGHDMTLLQHFLSRRHNDRVDEYGGSLENRARLIKEILRSEEHTSELQSLMRISSAVFCLTKNKTPTTSR